MSTREPARGALACSIHPGSQVRRIRTRGPRGPGMYQRCVPADGSEPHLVGWPGASPTPWRAVLSEAELDVLRDAAEGLTINETAVRREATPQAVKLQRANVLLKLGARNTAHAVAIGMRERLILLEPHPVVRRPGAGSEDPPRRGPAVPAGPSGEGDRA